SGANGIDALGKLEIGVRHSVGSGITELAAALVALDHAAVEKPVVAKEAIGSGDGTLGKRGTNAGGGNGFIALVRQIQGLHGKAMLLARAFEEIGSAATLAAEVEIGANDD